MMQLCHQNKPGLYTRFSSFRMFFSPLCSFVGIVGRRYDLPRISSQPCLRGTLPQRCTRGDRADTGVIDTGFSITLQWLAFQWLPTQT